MILNLGCTLENLRDFKKKYMCPSSVADSLNWNLWELGLGISIFKSPEINK